MTGVSRINLYSVFCERTLAFIAPNGRFGLVLASGLLTDDNNKDLFERLVNGQQLIRAWDFENSRGIFPGVHRSYKFALVCGGGTQSKVQEIDFAFYLPGLEELMDEQRHFSLSADELTLLNPNTKACPTFRNKGDATINIRIYRRTAAVCNAQITSVWPGTIKTPFNSANDSKYFQDYERLQKAGALFQDYSMCSLQGETWLPIYEPKFVHQFNHRYATFRLDKTIDEKSDEYSDADLSNPSTHIIPRYWLRSTLLNERFPGKWFFLIRNITGALNERTSIAAIIPRCPSVDANLLLDVDSQAALLSCGNMNSFVYDYLARQKIAGVHFNQFIWKQLPLISLTAANAFCSVISSSESKWISSRVLELTYTAWDLETFAQDCGWSGPPFRWDEERRFLLRCELDAAFFHLYLGPETEWCQQPAPLT